MSRDRDAQGEAAIRAQAAAWLARLQSEARTADDEAGCRAWMAEHPLHADAFSRATEAWQVAGGLERRAPVRGGVLTRRAALLAASVAAPVAVASLVWGRRRPVTYRTDVGERRQIALADGSTVTLDTDTELRVSLEDKRRQLELRRGRAHFAVASDPLRPFVVRAADSQVVAIGTAFDVSQRAGLVSVVLVTGVVAIEPATPRGAPQMRMAPGERVVLNQTEIAVQDRPNVARLTAWRSGRLVLDNEPLANAVREINRYSRRPIVVADSDLAARRISGLFGTDDPESFARSVATLLAADAIVEPNRIVLRNSIDTTAGGET